MTEIDEDALISTDVMAEVRAMRADVCIDEDSQSFDESIGGHDDIIDPFAAPSEQINEESASSEDDSPNGDTISFMDSHLDEVKIECPVVEAHTGRYKVAKTEAELNQRGAAAAKSIQEKFTEVEQGFDDLQCSSDENDQVEEEETTHHKEKRDDDGIEYENEELRLFRELAQHSSDSSDDACRIGGAYEFHENVIENEPHSKYAPPQETSNAFLASLLGKLDARARDLGWEAKIPVTIPLTEPPNIFPKIQLGSYNSDDVIDFSVENSNISTTAGENAIRHISPKLGISSRSKLKWQLRQSAARQCVRGLEGIQVSALENETSAAIVDHAQEDIECDDADDENSDHEMETDIKPGNEDDSLINCVEISDQHEMFDQGDESMRGCEAERMAKNSESSSEYVEREAVVATSDIEKQRCPSDKGDEPLESFGTRKSSVSSYGTPVVRRRLKKASYKQVEVEPIEAPARLNWPKKRIEQCSLLSKANVLIDNEAEEEDVSSPSESDSAESANEDDINFVAPVEKVEELVTLSRLTKVHREAVRCEDELQLAELKDRFVKQLQSREGQLEADSEDWNNLSPHDRIATNIEAGVKRGSSVLTKLQGRSRAISKLVTAQRDALAGSLSVFGDVELIECEEEEVKLFRKRADQTEKLLRMASETNSKLNDSLPEHLRASVSAGALAIVNRGKAGCTGSTSFREFNLTINARTASKPVILRKGCFLRQSPARLEVLRERSLSVSIGTSNNVTSKPGYVFGSKTKKDENHEKQNDNDDAPPPKRRRKSHALREHEQENVKAKFKVAGLSQVFKSRMERAQFKR